MFTIEKGKYYRTREGKLAYCYKERTSLEFGKESYMVGLWNEYSRYQVYYNGKVLMNDCSLFDVVDEASHKDIIDYMTEVMSESIRGKEIQVLSHDVWSTMSSPDWNWKDFVYRVKPEDKKESLTFTDMDERLKNGKTMWVRKVNEEFPNYRSLIVSYDEESVAMFTNKLHVEYFTYVVLKDKFEFVDGDKCYK